MGAMITRPFCSVERCRNWRGTSRGHKYAMPAPTKLRISAGELWNTYKSTRQLVGFNWFHEWVTSAGATWPWNIRQQPEVFLASAQMTLTCLLSKILHIGNIKFGECCKSDNEELHCGRIFPQNGQAERYNTSLFMARGARPGE
ncbi:hypothetical protein AJ78_03407 [Emergomyces pasteurianus Ep9510]|uniref:Uncharacterized protein n=1 Tax=Emergomyces pasteurianus Ep9510 TaxID=1447872 RepID=A0A1J9QKK9_9EURO|nr:hypothetical protein AJ78_03407 [Emergomyces pasteurianus Ep9510]